MTDRSRDYHDYVFRGGKLVGEFEDMYRYSEGVPWHQDEQTGWVDVRLTVQVLRDLAPFDEIQDLGCGLGYYLAIMRAELGAAQCRAVGYDISATACAKARAQFPGFEFHELDLTRADGATPPDDRRTANRLFIIRGTLWYVFPHMETVVRRIRSLLHSGDRLLVVQNFPPLDRPFIGKDVIPDSAALVRHFAHDFTVQRQLWFEDTLRNMNDNWFIGLFSPRETQ